MLIRKITKNLSLKFYIAYITIVNLGRCQLSGQHFGYPRFRQRTPVQNRPVPSWNSRVNTIHDGISGNSIVSSLRGHLNDQTGLVNRHISRTNAPHNTFYDTSREIQQPYVLLRGDRRIPASRSPMLHNRGIRIHTPQHNVANVQIERIRVLHGRTTPVNFGRNIARQTPRRLETHFSGRSGSMNSHRDLNHDRLRNVNRPMLSNQHTLSSRELSNQFQSRRAIVVERPRIRAESNEVFQYRTSISRTPRQEESGHLDNNNQKRFSGYPAQSLSLPFEPLSLRYRGFRESKLAAQQQSQSERIRNANNRDFLRNADILQGGRQAQVRRNSERAKNNTNITFYPRYIPPRNIRQGNHMAGDNTNVAADIRNMRPSNRRLIGFNNRHFRQNGFVMNNPPYIRNQAGLHHARRFPNDNGLSQPKGIRHNRRQNNTNQANIANGPLHEIFGISRTGLENALKFDSLQHDKSNGVSTKRPTKISVSSGNIHQKSEQNIINNRNKQNLIADITKHLEIADKINLLGLSRRQSQPSLRTVPNENVKNERDEILRRLAEEFLRSINPSNQQFSENEIDIESYND